MRFIQSIHTLGDKKIVKKFLWLPLTIKNETRWFENATIEYTYTSYASYEHTRVVEEFDWVATKFINI